MIVKQCQVDVGGEGRMQMVIMILEHVLVNDE